MREQLSDRPAGPLGISPMDKPGSQHGKNLHSAESTGARGREDVRETPLLPATLAKRTSEKDSEGFRALSKLHSCRKRALCPSRGRNRFTRSQSLTSSDVNSCSQDRTGDLLRHTEVLSSTLTFRNCLATSLSWIDGSETILPEPLNFSVLHSAPRK